LLPKPVRKTKPTLSSLILKESESHPNLALLPKSGLAALPKLSEEIRELATETYPQFRQRIREQLEQGIDIPGKSIVRVQGRVYILTQPKSINWQLPKKWWREIKQIGKHQYLYARWREADRQKSKSLGRVDLVD
jgi:hypothetical protein